MIEAELATCRVPKDPASPAMAGGYIKSCHARIRRILVHGVNKNSRPSLIPLSEGVVSPWVSLLELIFV
jgi:hypothetical protein